jgi:hypothetical protein
MKQTRNSRHIMKMLIRTLSVDMPTATPIPIVATTKMMQVSDKAMACPAIMLAKSRIIKAKGLVKIPTNSMSGISGKAFKCQGHIRPEDVFPIVLGTAELCDDERTECEEEGARDVTCQVTTTRWERHDTHHVTREDEEEAGEQIRRIFLIALSYSRLHDVVLDPRHQHLHQSCEPTGSRVAGLVLAVPSCRQEDAEQEDDRVDEKHGYRLCDADIERQYLFVSLQLYDLSCMLTLAGDSEVERTFTIAFGVGFLSEL